MSNPSASDDQTSHQIELSDTVPSKYFPWLKYFPVQHSKQSSEASQSQNFQYWEKMPPELCGLTLDFVSTDLTSWMSARQVNQFCRSALKRFPQTVHLEFETDYDVLSRLLKNYKQLLPDSLNDDNPDHFAPTLFVLASKVENQADLLDSLAAQVKSIQKTGSLQSLSWEVHSDVCFASPFFSYPSNLVHENRAAKAFASVKADFHHIGGDVGFQAVVQRKLKTMPISQSVVDSIHSSLYPPTVSRTYFERLLDAGPRFQILFSVFTPTTIHGIEASTVDRIPLQVSIKYTPAVTSPNPAWRGRGH